MCYEMATSMGGTGMVGKGEKIIAGGPASLIIVPKEGRDHPWR